MSVTRIYIVRRPTERSIEFFHDRLFDARGFTLSVSNADPEYGDQLRTGSVFLCPNPKGHEKLMKILAEENPGCSIESYVLESSAQTSVGPVVVKAVSEDGVLPDPVTF